jgi:L-galactono-1,4-lactone dehydrogenase
MCNIDKISVDTRNQTVAVGAGAKVSSVLHELKKHKLTLENFSSIQEQQIGGWTQVAAHGTGCSLSTVDDMIVEMKIATPTNGIMTLSRSQNNWIFDMCKVGLGNLGVVVEVTLKCIPEVNLKEETFVVTRDEIRKLHYARLQKYRHLRYMWIPYSQYVVVVASNPFESTSLISEENRSHCGNDATKPLVELAREVRPDLEEKYLNSLSFAVLRDILLDVNPLDVSYVQRINNLEAQFWINSSGSRIDDSTNILGFDCGGEQFVLELCFPIGPLEERSEKDVEFVESLLNKAESALLPIPSPIEQRWTSSSSSKMSPAYSPDKTQIYSWVGIIMYVPPSYQSFEQRNLIRIKFNDYCSLIEPILEKFNAVPHWAKVESPLQPINPNKDMDALLRLRTRLRKRYDVDGYNQLRISLDPCDILSNNLINILMPLK